MKKMLITGSNGFIGKNLIDYYSSMYEIITHTRNDDIKIKLKQNPDVIINCAANIYNEETMFDSNVILVYELLQYVKEKKIKMIQIGSSAEYGKKDKPSKETDNLEPRNLYEATKASATMLCMGFAKEYDLPIAVVRPYSVYGIHEKSYRLFPKLFDAFTQNKEMTLYQGYHDFIYIKDFLRGLNIL
jgi:nucleoside-diphosphate-sugar epimerase